VRPYEQLITLPKGTIDMAKLWLIFLVLAAIFGSCNPEELTAVQVEDALRSAFEGDFEALKAITCEAEQASIDQSGDAPILPEGTSVSTECSIDGEVVTCNMAMTVTMEGAEPQTTRLPIKINIEDGKLCGSAD
jgi:hypothetical protein